MASPPPSSSRQKPGSQEASVALATRDASFRRHDELGAGGSGTLLGIARHARPKGPMETIHHAMIGIQTGVEGDFRGAFKAGGRNRRQVTVMTIEGWRDALAEVAMPVEWQERRVNLLVDALQLEGAKGARLVFAGGAVLEITGECDPCSRMELVSPGLKAALLPHWRGGVTTRVIEEGRIDVGRTVRIER